MSEIESNSTILVTGADGFIGSHLTEELVRKGYTVRAMAQYNSFGSWGWLDNCAQDVKGKFEVVLGDIRDPYGVKNAMKGCNAVFHLAALIAIPYSYTSPDMYIDTNVKGTLNVLQAARELNVARVIHTSTSEVYGTAKFVPINEEHPLQGQSPYSASKIAADQIAFSFYSSFETPVITVRPFNTYGPRQSARAVIPAIITQIATGSKSINLGSTSPTRDFSFVTDTVAGFVAALENGSEFGQVINLGSNFEISIKEVAALIAQEMGSQIELGLEEVRLRPANSEVDRLWADNSKALRLINWKPKYVGTEGFRQGIQETIEWFADPRNLELYKRNSYVI